MCGTNQSGLSILLHTPTTYTNVTHEVQAKVASELQNKGAEKIDVCMYVCPSNQSGSSGDSQGHTSMG